MPLDIRRFFKSRHGLPDPNGSLSGDISSAVIASANAEVEKLLNDDCIKKNVRGPYKKYSAKDRAEIGKYASQHGLTAAAGHFSRKLGVNMSKSTIQSIKKSYLDGVREKRARDDEDLTLLPGKKRGRHLLLGDELDKQVQMYLKRVRDGGGVVSARIALAAARGMLLSFDKFKLVEYDGHIDLNIYWAYGLLERMKFVKRKATTAKSKYTVEKFAEVKESFLNDVNATVDFEEIPPELILNWDQTGIRILPSSAWTMDKQGVKRVEVAGANDKRLITAIYCGSLTGDFLPLQVIYQGKTPRCHPRFQFPSDWDITHAPKHWSTEETMVQYIHNIIIPYVESKRETLGERKPALVIIDNFKGQMTTQINQLLEENDIHVCPLPPNTTDLLQPMDISVNKLAKDFMKRKFEEWYSNQISKQLEGEDMETAELTPVDLSMPILKELGAKWWVEMAEYIADNPQFIVNGFVRAGIAGALDGKEQESDRSDTGDSEDDETDEESEIEVSSDEEV